MLMSNKKYCQFCYKPLNGDEHGNRIYCDVSCYSYQKRLRGNDKYKDTKAQLAAFSKTDQILKSFYELYGPEKFIPAGLLDAAGMDWHINKKELIIEGLLSKQIDKYAYSLFQNKTVKIWKV